MKRHEALQDLSRDHHVILLHARRLRGLDRRVSPEREREAFRRYAPTLAFHLEEEQALLEFLSDPLARDALRRDHEAVQRACAYLDGADEAGLQALGETLRLHARFVEEHVFDALQASLDEAGLAAAAGAARKVRERLRPGALGPDSAEACFL